MNIFSQRRAIPIPITSIGMRLPHSRVDKSWVAASKPQALGMVTNRNFAGAFFHIELGEDIDERF